MNGGARPLVVVTGPPASGKSTVAGEIAGALDRDIVAHVRAALSG